MTTLIKISILSLFGICFAIAQPAGAMMTNVDFRDVIAYGSAADQQTASALLKALEQSPGSYGLPGQIIYDANGAQAIGQSGIYSAEAQDSSATGLNLYLVYSSSNDLWLNKIQLKSVSPNGYRVVDIQKIDLTTTSLNAQIDIFNRQMIVTETQSGYRKFYPLSVGSLVNSRLGDTGSGYVSLSPLYTHAVLSREQSELSRQKPDYYMGRPFLRIVNYDQAEYGGFTPFGVHYKISDDFQRGFVSNGCFRLRDVDLYELATMVFLSKGSGVALSIESRGSLGNRHPFPTINAWFNMPRVTTSAAGGYELLKNEHGLFVFDRQSANPEQVLLGGAIQP